MPAISVNMLTKDQPGPTCKAVRSLSNLLVPGDEIVIVDTGSTPDNVAQLKKGLPKFEGVHSNIIERPDLSVELAPYIDKWLPEQKGKLEEDGQYHDLRGILDFAEARNVALQASRNPVIFWLDSDDVLIEKEPGQLRQAVNTAMDPSNPQASQIFLRYNYAFAEDGTLVTVHKRERFAFRDWFYWKGRCHETLLPNELACRPVKYFNDIDAVIQHTEARKKGGISDIRNYIIIRKELEELPADAEPDPRSLLYIGNACRGLHRWKEAVNFYKIFDGRSGSPEDRFAACLYIAQTYMMPDIQRPVEAHDWYQKAIDIRPQDPRGYFGLVQTYAARHRYADALNYFNIAQGFEEPLASLHSYDPCSVHYFPYRHAAWAATELGRDKEAYEYARRAYEYRPNDEDAKEFFEIVQNRVAGIQLTRAVVHCVRSVKGSGKMQRDEGRRLVGALHAVPPELERMGIGAVEQPDPRPRAPKLAIFCGETPEEWGPHSAKSGIGGSEKMVLLLAPELQKRGWNVTVYANVPYPARGVYPDGVRWQHWSEIDESQDLDIFVVWRSAGNLLAPVSARKRVLWLHDVQNPANYTEEILAVLDLVICQSEFHAEPLRGIVPDKKILVARNACAEFEPAPERDPKKVIFFSSPDRGATTALRIVAEARKIDPEINCTVLYGFSPYERKARAHLDHRSIPDLGRDASMDDYERYFGELIDSTGSRSLRRVGFEDTWKEVTSAGVWLYPTRFPEISCMAAMEAQVGGCVCLTSEYAALAETLLPEAKELGENLGPVENGDEYIQRAAQSLVRAVAVPADDPRRTAQAEAARSAYNVNDLADIWAASF